MGDGLRGWRKHVQVGEDGLGDALREGCWMGRCRAWLEFEDSEVKWKKSGELWFRWVDGKETDREEGEERFGFYMMQ